MPWLTEFLCVAVRYKGYFTQSLVLLQMQMVSIIAEYRYFFLLPFVRVPVQDHRGHSLSIGMTNYATYIIPWVAPY